MPLATAAYRLAKGAVDAAPPWLLRARPFGVYTISLAGAEASTTGAARWAASQAEVDRLAPVASPVNLDRWDGDTCRVAYAAGPGGEPIGAAWIDTGRFVEPDLGVAIELAADEAWLHSATVRPEHRRAGVYTGLLTLVRHTLASEAFSRLLLGVTMGNTASRVAHERSGAEPIGRLLAARMIGARAVATSGAVTSRGGGRFRLGRREIALRVDASE